MYSLNSDLRVSAGGVPKLEYLLYEIRKSHSSVVNCRFDRDEGSICSVPVFYFWNRSEMDLVGVTLRTLIK